MTKVSENQNLIQHELANAISHGFGVLFSVIASPVLIQMALQKQNSSLVIAVMIYCFTLLMMFSFSTLYHAIFDTTAKKILRIFDHISIFFLIGGSYTPFIVLFTTHKTSVLFFVTQWSLIFIGVIFKFFFTGKFRLLSSLVYVFIGCLIFLVDFAFWSRLPDNSLYLLIAGGLSYLVGVFFYQNQKIPYNHFIWHLFVFCAAVLHFIAVYFALLNS